MNNEEKILAMLAQMQTDISGVKNEITNMNSEISGIKDDITGMKDDITGIKLRLELDIEKRFDAVNKGIDAILERVTPKSRVDELEADVVVLKTAIRMLSQEVAELKKA